MHRRPQDYARPAQDSMILRNATVAAVDATARRVTVTIGGGDVAGVPYLGHFAPVVGMKVKVAQHRKGALVVGSLEPPPAVPAAPTWKVVAEAYAAPWTLTFTLAERTLCLLTGCLAGFAAAAGTGVFTLSFDGVATRVWRFWVPGQDQVITSDISAAHVFDAGAHTITVSTQANIYAPDTSLVLLGATT